MKSSSSGLNRRQALGALAAASGAARLSGQSPLQCHLRAGLVAYSYRKQFTAQSMSYEDLIRKVADWGLDGLDCTVYWFPNTSDSYLASLRKLAFKNGVQIYNAGVRVRLAQPTADLQHAEVENIKKWVDVADRLGASHVRVFGGAIPPEATEQQAIGWAVEVLKHGAEYAGTKGITLGVEDDGGLTTAAGPTIEIVKRTASPWAGINADSGNLRVDGYAQFDSMLPFATSVHLKVDIATTDGKKEPADWSRLLRMLGKAGYKGFVGLEYEGDNAEPDVPRLLATLRTLVRQVSG
jgi:L-ribulose-5-phosphate 3-epimerase